jgi:hypothetical protein
MSRRKYFTKRRRDQPAVELLAIDRDAARSAEASPAPDSGNIDLTAIEDALSRVTTWRYQGPRITRLGADSYKERATKLT